MLTLRNNPRDGHPVLGPLEASGPLSDGWPCHVEEKTIARRAPPFMTGAEGAR